MEEILRAHGEIEWPREAEDMYERVEVLGRGSFGVVWMARRLCPPENDLDDEFVALKNIEIKEAKGRIYAQREISILKELRHPNIIRLIRSFPIFEDRCQLVAMQMARGPNLQYLVTKRGALGLPLARLAARHLIAAVSYLHGRAVIHRDIKPTNCILENTELATQDIYDWIGDDIIWSDSQEAEKVVATGKFKLMVVDFGFARALENDDVVHQPRHLRNSIVNEHVRMSIDEVAKLVAAEDDEEQIEAAALQLRRASVIDGVLPKDLEETLLEEITNSEHSTKPEVTVSNSGDSKEGPAPENPPRKRRQSAVSIAVPFKENEETVMEETDMPASSLKARALRRQRNRQSTTRAKVRSMSALGTKAYAAPEIKHHLRNKTREDIDRSLEALTECVADYGMIVDAYSVGWTLRVILTGIPPNVSISQYMRKITGVQQEVGESGCLCFKTVPPPPRELKVRDTSQIPRDAMILITQMTKVKPEERITVRMAQNHPYILGGCSGDDVYELPQGDYPAKCGDPIVPLKCAKALADEQKVHKQ